MLSLPPAERGVPRALLTVPRAENSCPLSAAAHGVVERVNDEKEEAATACASCTLLLEEGTNRSAHRQFGAGEKRERERKKNEERSSRKRAVSPPSCTEHPRTPEPPLPFSQSTVAVAEKDAEARGKSGERAIRKQSPSFGPTRGGGEGGGGGGGIGAPRSFLMARRWGKERTRGDQIEGRERERTSRVGGASSSCPIPEGEEEARQSGGRCALRGEVRHRRRPFPRAGPLRSVAARSAVAPPTAVSLRRCPCLLATRTSVRASAAWVCSRVRRGFSRRRPSCVLCVGVGARRCEAGADMCVVNLYSTARGEAVG